MNRHFLRSAATPSATFVALALLATPLAAQERLTLQGAIATAQQNGAQGKSAELTREADRFRNRSFNASLMPQLSLSATVPSYTSSIQQVTQPDGTIAFRPVNQTSTDLALDVEQRVPLTGGTLRVQSLLNRFVRSGAADELWSSTPFFVSVTQPLLQPNPLGWERKRQSVSIEMSEKTYLASRENIALTVTNQFYDVYIAKLTLQSAIANSITNDTLFLLNKRREELGRIGATDLLRSELQATQAQQRVSDARIALERASAALRIALHLPPGSPLDLEVSLVVPTFDVDTARAMSEAARNLPAVDQIEIQKLQADQAVSNAKLTNNLNATLNAAYGYNANGDGFQSAYDRLLQAKRFSLSVSMPLMTFGQHKNEVRAAEADRERTVENASVSLEQMRMDAYFAALDLTQRRQALFYAAKADTLARRQFEGEYNRYLAGRSPSPEQMYTAQDAMNAAFSNYLNALRSYWVAYYTLRQRTLYDFEKNEPIR